MTQNLAFIDFDQDITHHDSLKRKLFHQSKLTLLLINLSVTL